MFKGHPWHSVDEYLLVKCHPNETRNIERRGREWERERKEGGTFEKATATHQYGSTTILLRKAFSFYLDRFGETWKITRHCVFIPVMAPFFSPSFENTLRPPRRSLRDSTIARNKRTPLLLYLRRVTVLSSTKYESIAKSIDPIWIVNESRIGTERVRMVDIRVISVFAKN